MSRIGKQPVLLPEKVTVKVKGPHVSVEGPKGRLEKQINNHGRINVEEGRVVVMPGGSDKSSRAFYGLTRALLNNMVIGVSQGFTKTLKIVGVGYKAQLQDKNIVLNLGYSHPIEYGIPEGITVEVPDLNTVVVSGIDKERVGQCAAEIRKFRKPEPYKGKGVMYADEHVRRKAGKAAVK